MCVTCGTFVVTCPYLISPPQEATSHDEDALLINIVIERIVNHAGCNAEGTLLGLLRTLIDPENMLRSLNRMEKSEFLAFFYKVYIILTFSH